MDQSQFFRAVVNRKRGNFVCTLTSVLHHDGTITFTRIDYDPSDEGYGDQRLDETTLGFGDEADILVYRGCGSLLEIEIDTPEGSYSFSSR